MYQVIIKNGSTETIIHYPSADKETPHLTKMDSKEIAGQASNFSFTIPILNPGYNSIFDLITNVEIQKFATNGTVETIFEGRVFNSEPNMDSSGNFYKEVICESELAYLNDTKVRIWTITNMSIHDYIAKVINNHNSHTSADKQFQLGNIEITGNITCTTNFENSLNSIIEKVINVYGGYLAVRKVNGIRYLDYLPILTGSSANIELANNQKDLNFSKDVTNIATRVIPIGKDNLTIESVNNGVDYLENADAVAEYGIIEQTIEFKDITDASALKTVAGAKLNDISKATYKLNTNVLDLSTIGLDSNGFYIGTDTNISNSVLNFSETFTIIEKDTDLLNPQNCKITLNDKFETLTDRQVALQRTAQFVNKILTADKQVNTFYLDGYINLLKNQMGAMADTAEKQLAKAILFEDKVPGSPTYGCVCLGTQGIMIADTIVNGEWDFRTFGTGKGFTADLIVTGHLLGGAVDFDLNQGKLKITHDDGSYSLFDADGPQRFINGEAYPYNFMTEVVVGEIDIIGTNSATATIPVPSKFQGKNFKCSKSMSGYYIVEAGYVLRNVSLYGLTVHYDTNTVTLFASYAAYKLSDGSQADNLSVTIGYELTITA